MVQALSAHSAALQMQIAICNDYLVCVQNVQNVQLFGSTIKLLLLLPLPLPPALDIRADHWVKWRLVVYGRQSSAPSQPVYSCPTPFLSRTRIDANECVAAVFAVAVPYK